jgi:hypothetical protein
LMLLSMKVFAACANFSGGNFALVDAEKAAPSRRTPKRFARNSEVPFLVCEPYPCYQRNPWLNLRLRGSRSGSIRG